MPTMPHTHTWQKQLEKDHGAPQARALLARAQSFYDEYCVMHTSEPNRANRSLLRTRLLPGLSLYRALLSTDRLPNSSRLRKSEALGEMDGLFRAAFFTGMVPGIRLLNRLPDPFPVVKPVLKSMTRQEYLPGSQEVVEDSPDCFAVHVYRCYIFDTLSAHGAPELTTLYCNTDDWLAELMPKVRWERTQTLGRGGDRCDFCWRRGQVVEKKGMKP